MMTPLHHRVLIKPDAQPTETESGLALALDSQPPETSGTVIARGHGPQWAQQIRRETIHACVQMVRDVYWGEGASLTKAISRLEDAFAAVLLCDRDVPIGARVLFSPASGQVVELEGERYLLMAEDDLLAVVEPDENAKEARVAA